MPRSPATTSATSSIRSSSPTCTSSRSASGPNTIEYKIGEIFGELKNKITSGYNLREIIDHVDELRFRSQTQKHELSALYEEKIKRMGNAGRNGGEYYTPRPLIRAMIRVVNPQLGETIYDGACGSAGLLCEAFDYLRREHPKRTVSPSSPTAAKAGWSEPWVTCVSLKTETAERTTLIAKNTWKQESPG